MTVPLYVEPREAPNHEKTIGGGATCDDLAEVLDLGKSMRNIIIGGLLSAPVWWFVFQLIGAMAK